MRLDQGSQVAALRSETAQRSEQSEDERSEDATAERPFFTGLGEALEKVCNDPKVKK